MVFSECNLQRIKYSCDEKGVAKIILDRPKAHNAFDSVMIQEILSTLEKIAADGHARVLCLESTGKNFSAGADLNWMKGTANYSKQQNVQDALTLSKLLKTLYTFPCPTIAKVRGACFGGGVGLVSCCDMAFADETARFCLSEVRLGLIPAVISPFVIRAMGQRQALRYMQTTEEMDAKKACDLELLHEVVNADELDAQLDYIVEKILKNGPSALTEVKSLIHEVADSTFTEELEQCLAEKIAALRVSAEGQEGLAAFLEKRKPSYRIES